MRSIHDPSDAQARSQPRRTRPIVAIVVVAALLGALVWAVLAWQNRSDPETAEQQPAPPTATAEPEPEPVCRAEGEFVAGFMSPQADDADTAALLDQMHTDAVTFGGRIEPIEADHYPEEVAEAIGDRQAYEYTVTMNWQDIDLDDTDQRIQHSDTEYGLIQATDDAVVVTESTNGADVFHSLTRVAAQRETQAYIGLPVPQMRTSGETWLPDNSYAQVIDAFNTKFVDAYHQRGADGFYLAMEMPLTDADHWNPVTDYYARQTELINSIAPDTTVLISPYLEGRENRETISPETAAAGYQKLLDLDNGTHILVSPQDGVGVGTTALDADESAEHTVTVEDYFAVLHETNPDRLYVTIEAMHPGGGSPDTREPTTRDRVEDQLDATAPYVQGAIGFQWSGPTAMTELDHIGDGACAAGPGQLN
ncbi:hypothetical protein GCM10023190_22100 [Enteractinococcus fodinae]|uniref:DUF4434 domain-containing protein n=1 Tax=Enteractinococcus fodinae TaxID=684663 RepID=A0ABU2B5K3_9MICC|nr:DUF4434 domain-containing protein [Enteractinococcus fodinae]MDR7348033.1 hypothetical protein [Enteractinococcus fodinae]